MIDFKYTDGGRLRCGYKTKIGDCFTRALTIATNNEYRVVQDNIIQTMRHHGFRATNDFDIQDRDSKLEVLTKEQLSRQCNLVDNIIYDYGFRRITKYGKEKYTLTEASNIFGECIAFILVPPDKFVHEFSYHSVALKGGALHDTFDWRYTRKGKETKANRLYIRLRALSRDDIGHYVKHWYARCDKPHYLYKDIPV